MSTYPEEKVNRALDSIDWEDVEFHQTHDGQHTVESVSRGDFTVDVTGGVTTVTLDMQNTSQIILGNVRARLQEALQALESTDKIEVAQSDSPANQFTVYAYDPDSRPSHY